MEKRPRVTELQVSGFETVMEGMDMRAVVLTLAAGECVPWHYHSDISDVFFCLDGPMIVETRAPRDLTELETGGRYAVPPRTAHYVRGKDNGPCRFLILQGTGVYDNVPVG